MTMSSTALEVLPPATLSPAANFLPLMTLAEAKNRRDLFVSFVKDLMVDGVDYGTVPGGGKPTLMKPGAEKLCTLFGLVPTFQLVERVEVWRGEAAFFYYFYKCRLFRSDRCQGEGDGSCNSMESKYRYRWVPAHELPSGLDKTTFKTRGGRRSEFVFAIDKAETTGQYGKPAEYWQAFRDAIENKIAVAVKKPSSKGKTYDAWEIDATLYRVENDDPADQVNTIQKMAQKRAYVAATLVAVNASEFFTQDIEEMEIAGHEVMAGSAPMPDQAPQADAQRAPVPTSEHAPGGQPPPAAPPTGTEQQLQESIEDQGKKLFKQVAKLCKDADGTLDNLKDYLRKTLCTPDLDSIDAFSKVEKLQNVMKEEARKSGAGVKMVLGFASDYRRQIAAAAAGAFVEAASTSAAQPPATPTPAPPPPAAPTLIERYMAIMRRVGMKDGMKLVNAYLDKEVKTHAVTVCRDPELQKRFAAIFEALELRPSQQLRSFLIEAGQPKAEGEVADGDGVERGA